MLRLRMLPLSPAKHPSCSEVAVALAGESEDHYAGNRLIWTQETFILVLRARCGQTKSKRGIPEI